ncbi:MAG: M28 family peptidase [Gemmatimonadales bacterium]
MRHVLLALLFAPAIAAAQSSAAVQRAVQSITPADLRRRIAVIADDSMRGRDTPSPELEQTAAYIAREFRRVGLAPGGDNGTFVQRYPLVEFVGDSSAAFAHLPGGNAVSLAYGTDFLFADNMFQSGDYTGELVVLAGPLSGVSGDTAALAGKMLVVTGSVRSRAERQRILAWRPAGVVLPNGASDSAWAQFTARSRRPMRRDPTREPDVPAVLAIRNATLQPLLARLGIDLAEQQRATSFSATPLRGAQLHVHARVRELAAPNVVGVLQGSDARLQNEYVVFSAHMDHVGVGRAVNGDSIYNGADDDASGTISVVELAEAFARLRPRPKRSMIFLTVSGEEKGLWGSAYFAANPPVPTGNMVANLNIDMVGRNWKDTVVVIGKEHSDLGATLHRVAAAHPELNMSPIDDPWPQERFYVRSDHYNFAREGVPILFFFSGTHADYHRPSDSPDKIDAEKQARIVKLVFYLGLEVANAAERPKWNPDSYKRIVTGSD